VSLFTPIYFLTSRTTSIVAQTAASLLTFIHQPVTNSSLVSLRSLARPENGAPKLGMTGSLHEKVLGKECSSLFFKGHQLINGTQGGRNRGTSDGSAPMSQKSRQRIARPSG
jgi:hypothetical protein